MKKFTDKYIASLKPEGKIVDIREGEGFGIRVLPSGVKTFFYIYRIDGTRRFLNLGHYDPKKAGKDDASITVEEARSKGVSLGGAKRLYTEAKAKVDKGIDPLAEKEQAATTRRNAHTVSDLIDDYIDKFAKLKRKGSWAEDERILNKDVRPSWKSIRAKDITRKDIMQLLDGMQGRGDGIITNTFKVIRRMFAYAVKKEIIATTPCYAFEKGDELPNTVSRERTLSVDEIKALWIGLDKAAMSEEVQRILKLILLTGQRPGEVAAMHRKEIDGKWWEFTPKETKITREIPRKQRVYLTDTVRELIGEGEGYVFKCKVKVEPRADGTIPEPRHITERAISHAVRRNLLGYEPKKQPAIKPSVASKSKGKKPFIVTEDKKIDIAHFTPHDLRRTCATFMSELDFSDATVDAVLAHLKKGEIRTYNKNKYDKEKQAALEAWERKLNSITSGQQTDNVIPFKRRAKA